MFEFKPPTSVSRARLTLLLVAALLLTGCGLFNPKRKISVPQLLTPLVSADAEQMLAEVNRLAAVRSLNGKVDLQFLDTSFATCGIADLYRTADGRVIVQRPGQIYLLVQAPFGVKIAEMSSTGEKFWAALYQGDEKFRRYVMGTNAARYERLEAEGDGQTPDCREDGARRERAVQRATVSALSSLRPQHFTDAILLPPATLENSNHIYAVAETFEEEPDPRPRAKKGARVVRGYYILSELEPTAPGRAHVLRRFWFDRVGSLRLSRVQSYNERGQLVTDVVYGNPQPFGEDGRLSLPAQVELTRPQESYSIRITFQDPGSVKVNEPLDPEIFALKNTGNLPEVDLDAQKK